MIRSTRPRSLLTAKLVFIAGIAIIAFVAVATIREIQRRNAIAREIHAMESEIARLESQRARVSDFLKDAETSEFLEREARLRLGLQKPGETVLVVPEGGSGAVPAGAATQSSAPEPSSNVVKWWRHLFR